jgi:hypothetical protein
MRGAQLSTGCYLRRSKLKHNAALVAEAILIKPPACFGPNRFGITSGPGAALGRICRAWIALNLANPTLVKGNNRPGLRILHPMQCETCLSLLRAWSNALKEYASKVGELKDDDTNHYSQSYNPPPIWLELAIQAKAIYDAHREKHAIGTDKRS